MCELMALSFASPISADFSIHEFALRGEDNADGWGLAWYPDASVAIVKEPLKWRESGHSGFLETYPHLQSRIYLAHVRHKTVGGPPTHADTHPFAREFEGRDYCFAHNGTILGHAELGIGRFRPVGHTDSEHVFCHLLNEMSQLGRRLEHPSDWHWLHQALHDLNRRGKLNCLLTDGRFLCCYHDSNGWKGLHHRKVTLRHAGHRRFEDANLSIDLEGDSQPVNHGHVVATEPLSKEGWYSFGRGQLIVLEHGHVRYNADEPKKAARKQPDRATLATRPRAKR
ncbi:MAG: class II glutamine amidotransferase [Gemmataceae bacterium]